MKQGIDNYQIVLWAHNVYYRASKNSNWNHTVGNKPVYDKVLIEELNDAANEKYEPVTPLPSTPEEGKFTNLELNVSNNIGKDGQKYVPAYFVTGKRIHCEFGILPEGYGFPPEEIEQSRKEAELNSWLFAAAPAMYEALKEEVKYLEEWNGNGNYTERITKLQSILSRISKQQ